MPKSKKRFGNRQPPAQRIAIGAGRRASLRTAATRMRGLWLRLRIPVISLFVAYHVIAIGLWLAPPFPLRNELLLSVRSYVTYLGFWQRWNVFAPDPKNWNTYLTAHVHFADGSTKVWEFPRMEKLNWMERISMERYRKWTIDGVNDPKLNIIWPDTVRFIARRFTDQPGWPVSVSLVRHWRWIQPPAGRGKPLPAGEGQHTLFTGQVNAEDLQ